MKAEILARLQAERAAQRPVVLLTRLSDGEQHLWPQEAVPGALAEAAREALGSEEAGNVTLDGETWFVHPHNPPLRIIVVGAVHIAQAMAPMAAARCYREALAQLASLREPVDAYFDAVMVNAEDAAVRANRLALLNQLRGLFLGVADISLLG